MRYGKIIAFILLASYFVFPLTGCSTNKNQNVSSDTNIKTNRQYNHELDKQLAATVEKKDVEQTKKLLAQGADPNCNGTEGRPLLWTLYLVDSSRKNDIDLLNVLLDAGADPNIEVMGYNLITHNLCYEAAKNLINHGANVNVIDSQGHTTLHYEKSDIETVKLMINAGCNVNAKNIVGTTVLMEYAARNYPEQVKILISAGADINAKDNEGKTALMKACDHERVKVVQILLNAGANVNIKANDGSTAISIAKKVKKKTTKETQEIISLLHQFGAIE